MADTIGSGLERYIRRAAQEDAVKRMAEAERRAQEIMAQAKQRIEIMRHDTADSTLLRVEQHRRRLLAQADLSAKQIHLDRRAEIMRQVWDSVERNLRADLDDQERLALIANGLADAAEQLEGGSLELQVNAQDAALVTDEQLQAWAKALGIKGVVGLSLADEPAPIWGGAIVRRADTRQLVDNSWNERLALAQRTLRNQIYDRLTPPASAETDIA